jgi:hypothetical protein
MLVASQRRLVIVMTLALGRDIWLSYLPWSALPLATDCPRDADSSLGAQAIAWARGSRRVLHPWLAAALDERSTRPAAMTGCSYSRIVQAPLAVGLVQEGHSRAVMASCYSV